MSDYSSVHTTYHGPFPANAQDLNWSAIDDNTYDGAPDTLPRPGPIGWGCTEALALNDLYDQLAQTIGEHYAIEALQNARR